MSWSPDFYPLSMQQLGEHARAKVIEIDNALLAEVMDERKAIRMAIAKGNPPESLSCLTARIWDNKTQRTPRKSAQP
jgi:hypothetical protein